MFAWLVDRANDSFFHLTDPCEFEADDVIDGVTAFEYMLTYRRLLQRAIGAVSEVSTIGRKTAAFEIAELIETLRRQWVRAPGEQKTECFKRLHHPVQGAALLTTALGSAPAPFNTYFNNLVASLYSDLETTIRQSVWVSSKASAQGVLVKNAALQAETLKPWPEFTAEVMRALRNAHHGYLTSEVAKQARPTRYLSLVTGDTPDSLSCLSLYWALATLVSPRTMLGWNWIPTAAFD